jgi:hypothetical protein
LFFNRFWIVLPCRKLGEKKYNQMNGWINFKSPSWIPKYHHVTVTIVTICDSVLWRLKAMTMRLVLESFKRLVLASSFWDFLWRPAFMLQNPSHCDGYKCDHLWQFCDSLKAVTLKTVKESFKSPSLSGFL